MPKETRAQLESDASGNWNSFYQHFTDKFFKDRNYLHNQFDDLVDPQGKRIAELGCGVGNTLFPLMERSPKNEFFACDFAPSAIAILQKRPEYIANAEHCHAFVCDISNENSLTSEQSPIRPNSIDIATAVFSLSAIDPEKMKNAARNIFNALAPGGVFLLRDYGEYDLTQMRFVAKGGRKIADNFYLRNDGTRVFYFTKEYVESLFESVGFKVSWCKKDVREIKNRKRQLVMFRVWLQARLVKPME
eukprot:TRINITY_DN4640_c2_g1_i1.p1 TRINITY_DN4640_c2_g1~~TRINITY_DN4640_c2_g1_i1.p1  ORF type:complete len:247 (+),score=67.97 TRINITY_DN4640_c2_g1_i1:3-743(+)